MVQAETIPLDEDGKYKGYSMECPRYTLKMKPALRKQLIDEAEHEMLTMHSHITRKLSKPMKQ